MRTDSIAAKSAIEPADAPSHGVRSVVSLLVFLHLFCVFTALSSNYSPSDLQSSFMTIMRFYTQQLNLDLFVTYQHTLGQTVDSDHRMEVLPAGADENDLAAWRTLPDVGLRGSERRHRYERYGEIMDLFVFQEAEAQMALSASSVGEYFLHQEHVKPRQIRCRRHLVVPLTAYTVPGSPEPRDAESPDYYNIVYAANAVVDEDAGRVEVVKIESAGQTAGAARTP